MTRYILLSLFCVFSVTVYSQQVMYDAADLYQNKKFEQAAELYTQAINQGIVKGNPYLFRGMSYFYLGEADKAIEDLKTYLQSDPNNPDVNNTIGLLLHETGKDSEAIAFFDTAISSDPNFAEVYINRGLSWIGLTSPQNAMQDYDKAIRIDSRNPYAWYRRAELNFKEERFDSSLSDLQSAIKLGLTTKQTNMLYAKILKYKNQFKQALTYSSKAIELDKFDTDALKLRATLYSAVGNTKAAEADKERMEEIIGVDFTPIEKLKFVKNSKYSDLFTFQIPESWVYEIVDDEKGEFKVIAVPKKYQDDRGSSPIGIKFLYYYDISRNFKGKTTLEVLKDFDDETRFQGMDMYKYKMRKRTVKKYNGLDYMTYTIESQPRPSDKETVLEKTIVDQNGNILIAYMYCFESEHEYFGKIFKKALFTLDFTHNKYRK